MSKSNQFWQCAEEAMLSARDSIDEIEKLALLDLARSLTQRPYRAKALPSQTARPATRARLHKLAPPPTDAGYPASIFRIASSRSV
jgi:hypothetical protein